MLFRRAVMLLACLMLSTTTLAVTAGPAAAAATDLYVDTTGSDAGPCSQAAPCATVQRAVDLTVEGTPAVIHVGAGWYTGRVSLSANRTLTIQGAGKGITVLNGNQAGTVLTLVASYRQIAVNDLSIVNGKGWQGGGLVNLATTTLTRVEVTFNQAEAGGGIFNGERLTMIDSILGYNIAEAGGGIYTYASGRMELRRTLVQHNQTARGSALEISGGGAHLYDSSVVHNHSAASAEGIGIRARGSKTRLEVVHSTIVGNWAPTGTAGASGVSLGQETDSWITGSIIADNSGVNCAVAATAGLRLRHDLVSDQTCATNQGVEGRPVPPAENEINGADPRLGPLTADNGGPTPTMALMPGSPAINRIAGADVLCEGADQRHVTRRPGNGGWPCDIGAYETQW